MNGEKTNVPSLYLVDPGKLFPHPLLAQYFQLASAEEQEEFKATIGSLGILHPIIAKKNGEIISGRERWTAAKALRLKAIPVRFMDFRKPELEEAAILAANVCVRWLSPTGVAKAKGRLWELLSPNGRNTSEAVLRDGDLTDLTPAHRKMVERHLKGIIAGEKRELTARIDKELTEKTDKLKKDLTQQNEKIERALGEVMEERDSLQKTLMVERREWKDEKSGLARRLNALRSEKEDKAKEANKKLQGMQKEVEKLRSRLGASSDRIETEAAGLGAREKKLLSLSLQISRIGPEVLLPCVLGLLEGRERGKEILGAVRKLTDWCAQMEQALEGKV